jgi:hypothetical protein
MQNVARSRVLLAKSFVLAILLALPPSVLLHAQAAPQQGAAQPAPKPTPNQDAADPHFVPVVDGALGPCTAEFTVSDDSGSPVYLAKISVHIAYGFMSLHKLDLVVSTNIDGKARFTGLPNNLKRGLYFQSSQNGSTGVAFDDPSATCKTQLPITLHKPLTGEPQH